MAHKDYRDTGVRILESSNGDVMVVDDANNMTLQIPAKDIEESLWTERAAFLVVRQIIRFVRKSSELKNGEPYTKAKLQAGEEAKAEGN